MNEVKKAIDDTLSEMKFSKNKLDARYNKKYVRKYFAMPNKKVQVILCTLLLGTTLLASGIGVSTLLKINGEELPPLEPMYRVPLNEVEGDSKDEYSMEKYYESMEAAEKDLGIKLLGTQYTHDNPHISVHYEKIGKGYNTIKVSNYAVGDLINLRLLDMDRNALDTEGRNVKYIWTLGNVYKTPVDLTIEIISDDEQQILDTEYLGYFKYIDTYTSEQGYTVNLLQDTIDNRVEVDAYAYRPQVKAIFVVQGLRYTLTGRIPAEEMKTLVETMQ